MRIETVTAGAPAEGVAELAERLRLPVGFTDAADAHAQLSRLLAAAIAALEERTRRFLIARSLTCRKPDWDDGEVAVLPVTPVVAVERVAVADADGVEIVVSSDVWRLELLRGAPHVRARAGRRLPATPPEGHVAIAYVAGYGPAWADAPHDLRQAAVILAAAWFDAGGAPGGEIPPTVTALLAPYRRVRL